jgi:hypothetical protein
LGKVSKGKWGKSSGQKHKEEQEPRLEKDLEKKE